jgi:pimeloyl-ACP methyl ester carboxylesterase
MVALDPAGGQGRTGPPVAFAAVPPAPRARSTLALAALVLGAACATEADPGDLGLDRGQPPSATTPATPTAPDGDAPDPLAGPGGFVPDPPDWERCGTSECATVVVPLDYADPDGDTFELLVLREPATGAREGALFVNPGGPGASATEIAALAAVLLPDAVTERFDIVGVDPRGVGGSTPVRCGVPVEELYGVDPTLESPQDEAALLDVSRRYVQDCEATHGDLLPHLGTRNVARDMDAVRAAMGDEQLGYLGFSYGSVIGQVYADEFPDRVRAMVLDGIVELGPSGPELATEQARGFEVALGRFARACEANRSCLPGRDVLTTVDEVLAAAEVGDGIPAPRADRAAGPGEVTLGIAYALYAEALWRQLGNALADAADGDGSRLVGLADGYIGSGSFEVYFAVNCLDFDWPDDPAETMALATAAASVAPRFGEAIVNDYIRCSMWPVPADPLGPVTAPGTPPILVISTTGDPATPYEAGVAVAERLASGVLVTNDGDGHTVVLDGRSCIDDIVERYLVDLEAPASGTSC